MFKLAEEDTSSSFDEDEESYTVVDEEMDSRTFHHPINRNSDYAERRYFGMETSLQLPNEPKPFPAYSHQKNSGGKASRYMYTNPSQQSVKDIRCHSTDAAQELHQELRSHQMKGYKHEYNEGVPQTTKAPAVNRGLKPEKLSFQVKAANIEKISFGKLNPADDISRHGGSAKGPMKSTRISKMQNSREIGFASHHQANEFFSRSSEQETEGAQSFCDRPQRPYIEQCGTRHEDHQWTPPFQKEEAIWGDTTQNTQDYDECNWYVREYDRKKAEQILFQEKKDGAFLVRDSREMTIEQPYVLSVYFQSKVYNIKIRYLEESEQYALGTGLRGNEKFDSVQDIIEFHRRFPVKIIDGKKSSDIHGKECYLTQPPHLSGQR
uniref:SH2 domain-containing protein n=2 Tax=Xenopus tropicalis TaxID=8364 RepID=A0A803JFY2_XENTR